MKKLIKIFSVLLALVAVVSLASCAPKDGAAAKEKMDKAGYVATWSANKEVGENGEVGSLVVVKGISTAGVDGLTATLYKTGSQAKKAFNDSKDAEGKTNLTLVGKWVCWGSEEAIKAFKK